MSDADTTGSSSVYQCAISKQLDHLPDTLFMLAQPQPTQRKQRLEKPRAPHFRKQITSRKWSKLETARFYELLEVFGTDFQVIAQRMGTRSKKEVLNKYKKEAKRSSIRISQAFQMSYQKRPLASMLQDT